MRIEFTASDGARAALAAIGRTEDVHFSPDNRRLAIAGFGDNRILVLDVDINPAGGAPGVSLKAATTISSAAFKNPHGLFWIDNDTIAVANRDGELPIIRAPASLTGDQAQDAEVLGIIRSDATDGLSSPGSVSIVNIGDGLCEATVCNNYVHYVSRHLIDMRQNYSVLTSDIFLSDGLDVPDGVAHSASAAWLAISNHNAHSVFLYRNDPALDRASLPVGVLRGMSYPHGLRFTPDERILLVADAGLPFVHVFFSETGDWSGERLPVKSMRVLDDETFERGRFDPQNGGPKGVALDRAGAILIVSCDEEPLVFYDISQILAEVGGASSGASTRTRLGAERADERELLLQRLAFARDAQGELRQELIAAREDQRLFRLMLGSLSWRLTAPLRKLKSRAPNA